MRIVLFSFLICAAWPAAAQADLAQCAGIDSALERLDCYDRLAREALPAESAAQGPEVQSPSEPQPAPQPPAEPDPMASKPAARAPAAPSAAADPAGFGLPQKREAAPDAEFITARIESVRKAPLGQHILTLSNGQVWAENEAGRRRIAAGQDVVIRKHRWHYEMELPNQPNVAVRRVD